MNNYIDLADPEEHLDAHLIASDYTEESLEDYEEDDYDDYDEDDEENYYQSDNPYRGDSIIDDPNDYKDDEDDEDFEEDEEEEYDDEEDMLDDFFNDSLDFDDYDA